MELLEVCHNGVTGAYLMHLLQNPQIVRQSITLSLQFQSGLARQLKESFPECLQTFFQHQHGGLEVYVESV